MSLSASLVRPSVWIQAVCACALATTFMKKRLRIPLADHNVGAGVSMEEPARCESSDFETVCRCRRIPRRGWSSEMLRANAVGVHEVWSCASQTRRYHATFGSRSGQHTHLGCFSDAKSAAAVWDAEAR